MSVADIDPEAVRGALRDFVSQLASSERERVSVKLLTLLITFLSSLHKNKNCFIQSVRKLVNLMNRVFQTFLRGGPIFLTGFSILSI